MSIESLLIPVCYVWPPPKLVEHGAGVANLLPLEGIGAVVYKPHGHEAVLQAGIPLLKHCVDVTELYD